MENIIINYKSQGVKVTSRNSSCNIFSNYVRVKYNKMLVSAVASNAIYYILPP